MGLNDKESKKQEISTLEAYKVAINIIKALSEGGTIYEAHGFYTHQDGSVTIEPTLRIELMFIEKSTVQLIVDRLKTAFNQESIAVQDENVTTALW